MSNDLTGDDLLRSILAPRPTPRAATAVPAATPGPASSQAAAPPPAPTRAPEKRRARPPVNPMQRKTVGEILKALEAHDPGIRWLIISNLMTLEVNRARSCAATSRERRDEIRARCFSAASDRIAAAQPVLEDELLGLDAAVADLLKQVVRVDNAAARVLGAMSDVKRTMG